VPAGPPRPVNAAVRFIVFGAMPVGGFLGGVVGAWLGSVPALWIAVGGSVLAADPVAHGAGG
jgi:hypothetical protein